jgi:hypothetical protein
MIRRQVDFITYFTSDIKDDMEYSSLDADGAIRFFNEKASKAGGICDDAANFYLEAVKLFKWSKKARGIHAYCNIMMDIASRRNGINPMGRQNDRRRFNWDYYRSLFGVPENGPQERRGFLYRLFFGGGGRKNEDSEDSFLRRSGWGASNEGEQARAAWERECRLADPVLSHGVLIPYEQVHPWNPEREYRNRHPEQFG